MAPVSLQTVCRGKVARHFRHTRAVTDLAAVMMKRIKRPRAIFGRRGRLRGGRFNPKGIPALYTAMSVMNAIREANQIGTLRPTMLD